MRSHRLHLPKIEAGTIVIHGSPAHYLGVVRRASVGDEVEVFDGKGSSAIATVSDAQREALTLDVGKVTTQPFEGIAITLATALLKGDKLADVVRQGTELGVYEFAPVITRRADVKVLSPNKLTRLRRVAEEASRQAERTVIPNVREAVAIADAQLPGTVLLAHPTAQTSLKQAIAEGTSSEFTIITGPEGGFTDEEVAEIVERYSATVVSLGTTVLRAETAPIAAVAAVRLWHDDA